MTTRESGRSWLVLVAVAMVIVSTLAPVVSLAAVADGGASPSDAPSGMAAVGSTNIEDIRPSGVETSLSASELHGAVYVSEHADSTEVSIVTGDQASEVAKGASPSDVAYEAVCSSPAAGQTPQFECDRSMGLVISDDVEHDGREVAVRVDVVEDALGFVPETIGIANNETGETWNAPATVRDGWLIADVEHFSSNAVSFEGTVSVEATPAQDGDSFSTNVSDLDAVDNFDINVTGAEQTEWDNASASGLGDGDSLAVDPAGHEIRGPASGEPEVVFTGEGFERWDNKSASGVSASSSQSISVDGNLPPSGPSADAKPMLTVTDLGGMSTPYTENGTVETGWELVGDDGLGKVSTEWKVLADMERASELTVDIGQIDGQGVAGTVDIYVAFGEGPDGTIAEGTLVKEGWTPANQTGNQTVQFDDVVSVPDSADKMTVAFEVQSDWDKEGSINLFSSDDDSTGTWYYHSRRDSFYSNKGRLWVGSPTASDVGVSADGASHSFGDFSSAETKSAEFALSESASALDFSATQGTIDYSLEMKERKASQDPALDLDGDGTTEVAHSETLMDGETASYQASSLDPGDGTATVSTSASSTVGVDVRLKEVSETRDPTIDVNGHTTSYSGTLADGETVSLDTNTSWIQEGENQINVLVGDGSLSSDAPTPSTGLDYSHDAKSTFTVDYAAEALSVRYEVGKNYTSDQSDVEMRIPFENTVSEMRDVEKQMNGGGWSAVDSSNYRITDENELSVDVGDVSSGDVVEVRANGSRVRTHNMSITVEEATAKGDELDSKIAIDSIGENAHMTVTRSDGSERLFYPTLESWDSPKGYVEIGENGRQDLYLPNAADGSTFRLKQHGTEVIPQSNEVKVRMEDSAIEPKLRVMPGATEGDDVKFVYYNTESGEPYVLQSVTNGVTRDSAEANSPVTLTDDDSLETLYIFEEDSNTTSTPGDDGDDPVESLVTGAQKASSTFPPEAIVLGAIALTVVIYFVWRKSPGDGNTLLFVTIPPLWVVALELVGVPIISAPVARAAESFGRVFPALALLFGGIAAYGIYVRYIKGVAAEAATPDKVNNITIRGDDDG